jgi:hypothetical protein
MFRNRPDKRCVMMKGKAVGWVVVAGALMYSMLMFGKFLMLIGSFSL